MIRRATTVAMKWRQGARAGESTRTDRPKTCSFCGKSERKVLRVIAGPGVAICNECIDLCNEILAVEAVQPRREAD